MRLAQPCARLLQPAGGGALRALGEDCGRVEIRTGESRPVQRLQRRDGGTAQLAWPSRGGPVAARPAARGDDRGAARGRARGDRLLVSAGAFDTHSDSGKWRPHVTQVDLVDGAFEEPGDGVDFDCSMSATVAAAGPFVAVAWRPVGRPFQVRVTGPEASGERWVFGREFFYPALALEPESGSMLACVSADLCELVRFDCATGECVNEFTLPKLENEALGLHKAAPMLLWLTRDVLVVQRCVPGGRYVDSIVLVYTGEQGRRYRTSTVKDLAKLEVMRFEHVAGALRGPGRDGAVWELRIDMDKGKLGEAKHIGKLERRRGAGTSFPFYPTVFAFEPTGRPFVALATGVGSVTVWCMSGADDNVPELASWPEEGSSIKHLLWVETSAGQRIVSSHDDATACVNEVV